MNDEADGGTILSIRDLRVAFGETEVLRGIDLDLERGETVALLGPSGSGKTTLLRVLMGFVSGSGSVSLRGRDLQGISPHRRGIGLVFQNYALFPHLDVRENVAFGPRSLGWETSRIDEKVQELLQLVDLQGYAERRISELSGGQQQRIALARALASEPDLLLLDEPLSNLDPDLRERTRSLLGQALDAVETACLLVTHEQDEAFELGDRVAVLASGRLEQIATPRDLYWHPTTEFVAGFIGRTSRVSAVATGGMSGGGGDGALRSLRWHGADASSSFEAVTPSIARRQETSHEEIAHGETSHGETAGSFTVYVRPEQWQLTDVRESSLVGRLVRERFVGAVTHYELVLADGVQVEVVLSSEADHEAHGGSLFGRLHAGEEVGLRLRPGVKPVAFPASRHQTAGS